MGPGKTLPRPHTFIVTTRSQAQLSYEMESNLVTTLLGHIQIQSRRMSDNIDVMVTKSLPYVHNNRPTFKR